MKKKILFLVNIDSFFVSHRLSIATTLLKQGFEVHVGTQYTSYKNKLKKLGIVTHSINFNRNSFNLLKNLLTLKQIFKLVVKVRPDIFHLISIKPIMFGGLLSYITPVKSLVISITGLGSMFIHNGVLYKLREKIFNFLYRIIFLFPNLKVILQNNDDLNHLIKNCKLNKKNVILIKGSGVNLKEFKFTELPKGRPIIMMISRIIKDKGIFEFIESAKILNKNKFFQGNFYLIGDIDKNNPSAINRKLINEWKKKEYLKIFKHQKNIYKWMKKSTLIVLPSYREGFPKVIMEAASCGRPVITTNVPGCRDAILNNKTGFLIPPKNSKDLSKTIFHLSKNKKLLRRMGRAARIHAKKNFDIKIIISKHLKIYENL